MNVTGDVRLVLEGQGDLVESLEEAILGERSDIERVRCAVRPSYASTFGSPRSASRTFSSLCS